MPSLHKLLAVQKIPVSLETAWKYFSDPHNLFTITPPALNLKMNSKLFGDEVYPGQVMTYTVKPVLGIPFLWMTEITHVNPMKMFVDDQRKGPYAIWHHEHHFKTIESGVEITDLIHYQLPFGFLGNLSHGLVVKPKLKEIFKFRYEKICEIFGSWPEETMNLQIE